MFGYSRSSSGKFLYGSNRGHESIVAFKVEEQTGRLTSVGHESTQGKFLRGFVIDPTGTFPDFSFQDAVAFGTSGNADALYVGVRDDVLIRTTSGGALTTSVAYPGTDFVRSVVMDPTDFRNAFVIDRNQVFHTNDAGVNWVEATGNIMSIAGDILQTIEFIPGPIGALVVGGALEVFTELVNAVGSWAEIGLNLPNAVVYDLDYDMTDDVLVAGTMGRGAWMLANAINLAVNDHGHDVNSATPVAMPSNTAELIDRKAISIGCAFRRRPEQPIVSKRY